MGCDAICYLIKVIVLYLFYCDDPLPIINIIVSLLIHVTTTTFLTSFRFRFRFRCFQFPRFPLTRKKLLDEMSIKGQLSATKHQKKLDEMEQGHSVRWPLASVCLCVDVMWFVHRMECPVWQCESVTLLS